MTNIKMIDREAHEIVALVVLCQDYVLADEEFMANEKIKKNMQNAEFWIELAHSLRGAVAEYIRSKSDSDGYDECDSTAISERTILNFVLDPANRFELNDIICDSVENWLKYFGNKRFK